MHGASWRREDRWHSVDWVEVRGADATMDSTCGGSTVANRDKARVQGLGRAKSRRGCILPRVGREYEMQLCCSAIRLEKIRTESLWRLAPRGESMSACMAAPAFRFASWPFMASVERTAEGRGWSWWMERRRPGVADGSGGDDDGSGW
jgi:hypothetical protein